MEASEEVAGSFFVACCNAREVFDGVEETFDEIALGVEREIAVTLDLAI